MVASHSLEGVPLPHVVLFQWLSEIMEEDALHPFILHASEASTTEDTVKFDCQLRVGPPVFEPHKQQPLFAVAF